MPGFMGELHISAGLSSAPLGLYNDLEIVFNTGWDDDRFAWFYIAA